MTLAFFEIYSYGFSYIMDGEMQMHYLHSVPKRNREEEECDNKCRLTVVFRAGENLMVQNDSGKPVQDLSPKAHKKQIFGRINEIFEGHSYTRLKLFNLNAHRMQQRGISGNQKTGADAIIVSGHRKDKLEEDNFHSLLYAAERGIGALGLVESYKNRLPIRVFRSSKYRSALNAVLMSKTKDTQTKYRYDGLYQILSYDKPTVSKGAFVFQLRRSKAGSDAYSNHIRTEAMIDQWTALGTF